MASTSRSTKLSPALAEASEIRARNLGYASWNAYIKALLRYDMMIQGEHTVTKPISHLRLDQQDQIDEEMLELTKNGVGVRGQWLENTILRVTGSDETEAVSNKIVQDIVSGCGQQ